MFFDGDCRKIEFYTPLAATPQEAVDRYSKWDSFNVYRYLPPHSSENTLGYWLDSFPLLKPLTSLLVRVSTI